MSQAIRRLYKNANLKPPDGKGIHTVRFHRLTIDTKKKHPDWSMGRCYKYAMGGLTSEYAVKKPHRQPKSKISQKISNMSR